MKSAKFIIGIVSVITLAVACNSNSRKSSEYEDFTLEQIDSLKRIECDTLLSEMRKIKADTFIKVNSVPENYEESLVILDSMMNPKMKEWIKCLPDGEFGVYVHHGFGTYLRNNWELWGNSKLTENLSGMGIFHPDDMSAIILDSYQRKLKGEAIRIEEQLKFYQDYWRDNGVPVDSILNELKNKEK